MFDSIISKTPNQFIEFSGRQICIKRLDLIHLAISGNKFFKLKYNFMEARKLGYSGVLTFGGAFSNHIAATAYAAHLFNFKSIGIIRGEELAEKPLNKTLKTAQNFAMEFNFVSREMYRLKDNVESIDRLKKQYPNYYMIPEGGTNALAIQGCKEILTHEDLKNFDLICCAVGTGGTISGLIEASCTHQKILGFSALKGDFLTREVKQYTTKTNWEITDEFCFGGYAKTSPELLNFMYDFEQSFSIPLEQVYTAKMMYGLSSLIQNNKINADTRILVIHSGGLQGKLATE